MSVLAATDFRRIAVSAFGALLVSATCVAGAIVPARAAGPAPAAGVTVTVIPATGLVGAVRY